MSQELRTKLKNFLSEVSLEFPVEPENQGPQGTATAALHERYATVARKHVLSRNDEETQVEAARTETAGHP